MENFFKSGRQYFFNLNGSVVKGTLHYCENCGAPCYVNTVKIITVPSKLLAARYNSDMNDCSELFYNGDRDESLCLKCDN